VAQKIFITFEVNCYVSKSSLRDRLLLKLGFISTPSCRGYASIWITVEPYNPQEDDYTERGVKIVGPLPAEQAQGILTNLKCALETAGVPVEVEIVADD
jgi:hypothetical protein